MTLQISDKDFSIILSTLGYPAVPLELLEFDESTIKDTFIQEALDYYFSRFPLRDTVSQRTTAEFSIDFPDEDTFGILDARVNRRAYGATTRSLSAFQNELLYKSGSSRIQPESLSPNSFRGLAPTEAMTRVTERQVTASNIALRGSQRINVLVEDRKVSGYVNTDGELLISWAKTSSNFDKVPNKDRQYVLWYAQSIVLKRFAMLRDQANTNQGVDFNTGPMHTESDNLKRDVMDKWAKRRAVVIIRG